MDSENNRGKAKTKEKKKGVKKASTSGSSSEESGETSSGGKKSDNVCLSKLCVIHDFGISFGCMRHGGCCSLFKPSCDAKLGVP